MSGFPKVRRQVLAGYLGACAALVSSPGLAGLLTTDRTVGDFSFKGSQLDYRPAPWRLGRPFATRKGSSADPALDPEGGPSDAQDPLGGSLHLGDGPKDDGYFDRASFARFGILPAAASLPDSELLATTAKALAEDGKTYGLERLVDRQATSGPLTGAYRGAGIFVLAAGVDETGWIQGYPDAPALARLIGLEAGGPERPRGAAPLPSSLALLACGLPFLVWRRRWGPLRRV